MNSSSNTTNQLSSCSHVKGSLVSGIRIAVQCIILVPSLIGNSAVVAVVYRRRESRTNINCFIASMAISDLLFMLFGSLFHMIDLTNGELTWIDGAFGEFSCRFLPYLIDITKVVSIFTMIAIAVDKFYGILFPLKAALINSRTRQRTICVIWTLSAITQSYQLPAWHLLPDISGSGVVCTLTLTLLLGTSTEAIKSFVVVLFILDYALPFVILLVLYTAIVLRLYHKEKALGLVSTALNHRETRNKKITIMFALVSFVFLAAWAPNWIWVIRYVLGDHYFDCVLRTSIQPAMQSYTLANPLIYYFFNDSFRRGFKEIFTCTCKKMKYFRTSTRGWNPSSQTRSSKMLKSEEHQVTFTRL